MLRKAPYGREGKEDLIQERLGLEERPLGEAWQECFLGAEQGGNVPGGGKGMGKVSCWVMQKRGQGPQPAPVLQAVLDSWEGSEPAREEGGDRKMLPMLFVLFLVVAAILLADPTW